MAGLRSTIFRNKPGSPYQPVGDTWYEKYRDEDYLDLYSLEGKPGLSPVLLGFVTVFQALEGLSDREAANAVVVRLDWKYALHLPLEYAGFDFSVLSEYRERLAQHGAEGRLFERALADLEELGVLKRHGRQRTDSLAVLTRVRTLNRLELVMETLRVAVCEIVAVAGEWARMVLPPGWEERYGERCVYERLSEKERAALQQEVGRDGQWLLERLEEESTLRVPGLPAVILRQETDFPSSGKVVIHVQPEQAARFALHLRIPPYAAGAEVQVGDGKPVPAPAGDFVVLEREWKAGDSVELTLPFRITCQANDHALALVRGPLVYAYFQEAQADPVRFYWSHGMYPEDVVLHVDPARPGDGVQEEPVGAGLLGPALRVTGHVRAREPVFALSTANSQLSGRQEQSFLLYPFVNQGAIRGEYRVFVEYARR